MMKVIFTNGKTLFVVMCTILSIVVLLYCCTAFVKRLM